MYFTISTQQKNNVTFYYWKMWESKKKRRLIATSYKPYRSLRLCKKRIRWIKENAADADVEP